MLKKFVLGFVIMLVTVVVGCSNNNSNKSAEDPTNVPSMETKIEEAPNATTKPKNLEPKMISINEPYKIDANDGSYTITLTGVHMTDWAQRSDSIADKEVVVLEYIIENIDFENEAYAGVTVGDNALSMYDENSFKLKEHNMWYKEFQAPELVLPGYKGKFGIGYILDEPSESFEVVFTRGNEVSFKSKLTLIDDTVVVE